MPYEYLIAIIPTVFVIIIVINTCLQIEEKLSERRGKPFCSLLRILPATNVGIFPTLSDSPGLLGHQLGVLRAVQADPADAGAAADPTGWGPSPTGPRPRFRH